MPATPAPVALTSQWRLLGPAGFEYLIDVHDGLARIAFDVATPSDAVLGHGVESGDALSPPSGMALYGKAASGVARLTITQGDAL
jgi:hypothetical protein